MIALLILLGLTCLSFGISYCLLRSNLHRKEAIDLTDHRKLQGTRWEPFEDDLRFGIHSIRSIPWEDVYCSSCDGLKLHARLFDQCSERTVLLLHGYRSSGENDFCGILDYYVSHGFNIVLIDQRAHGASEGKMVAFGLRERYDAALWADFASKRFSGALWYHGVSMGAVSALMSLKLEHPPALRGVIADSCYDNVAELLRYQTGRRYHLPFFPTQLITTIVGRWILGKEYSKLYASREAALSKLPILLIHGDRDHTIPPRMPERFQLACGNRCKSVVIANARHAMCWLTDPTVYEAELDN